MIALTVAEANSLLWALALVGVGAAIGAVARRDTTRCRATGCPLNRGHDGRCLS